jgi:hypothetical protein
MTDVATIAAGYQSLKSAFEIGKTLLKLSASVEIQDRIREMNEKILAAQESAIASRDYQSALLKQISELETKIAEFEKWDAEAERYELADVRSKADPRGTAIVYVLKEARDPSKPQHFLCTQCFEERHKSILQKEKLFRNEVLICNRCESILYLVGQRTTEDTKVISKRPRK